MKMPRDLSGKALIACLCQSWGYRQVHQVGSHVILETDTPVHQRISVPNHNPLRIGTLNSILKAVSSHKGIDRLAILNSL